MSQCFTLATTTQANIFAVECCDNKCADDGRHSLDLPVNERLNHLAREWFYLSECVSAECVYCATGPTHKIRNVRSESYLLTVARNNNKILVARRRSNKSRPTRGHFGRACAHARDRSPRNRSACSARGRVSLIRTCPKCGRRPAGRTSACRALHRSLVLR